jgi:Ca2+-binding EF-hand superfamily protein
MRMLTLSVRSTHDLPYAEWFHILDADGDGYLTLDDFDRTSRVVAAHHGLSLYERRVASAHAAWLCLGETWLDRLGASNGYASLDDFIALCRALAAEVKHTGQLPDWSTEQVELWFEALDLDGDGRVSPREYTAFLSAVGARPEGLLGALSPDPEGYAIAGLTARYASWWAGQRDQGSQQVVQELAL